jgi:hypothetical protein
MSRDVGTFSESKNIQTSMEKREAGYEGDGPAPGKMKDAFVGGKVQPTFSTFKKPGMGKVRKHME